MSGLSPKQIKSIREAINGTARVNMWHGAVRSGKTMSSILAWLDFVDRGPSGNLVMIGKTKDTLRANVLDEIDKYFGPEATPLEHTPGANTGRLFGRTVYMLGANDAKAEGSLRGRTLVGSYVDEATLLPNEQYWSQLISRHLTEPNAKIFASTNPDNPSHHIKKKVIDAPAAARVASWHFMLEDNPVLTPDRIAEARASMSGLFAKRFLDGLWCVAEGAVYPKWDEARFVVRHEDLPPIDRLLAIGMDHANSTNSDTVAHLVGLARFDGVTKVVLIDEWMPQREQSDRAQVQQFRAWLGNRKPEALFVDPAAKSMSTALFEANFNPHPANNAVLDGIQTIASLMDADLFAVSDRCTEWIRCAPAYMWDSKAVGVDRPVKAEDHALDSGRYGIHSSRHQWAHLVPLHHTPGVSRALEGWDGLLDLSQIAA